ncbi:MAG: hypothetical protein BAJATHORv1_20620 [Candidatus Thorarchaeota archaeon]|nr:MAG: hypothetical protein BAJATHORv1_20620 [Candidatus Thorarchaeota archaeon]
MSDDTFELEIALARESRDLKTTLAIIRTIEAEKRTHLAELRTGIGIMTIPLSLLTILIATSNYYNVYDVIGFVIALVIGIVALLVIGITLVRRAFYRIRRSDLDRDKACLTTSCVVEEYFAV